ncbi:hypothetical protein M885DRAFT_466300 [Pelagophyceae sp. CCMP2097]|nr:hypothetical protein M885DRAFT_466300 [Pelagophyceae sp. CCMP2097]
MPAPKTMLCYICGRQFGASSLDIHIPQCKKRYADMQAALPKEDRRPLPKDPRASLGSSSGDHGEAPLRASGGHAGGGSAANDAIDAYNAAAALAVEEAMAPCANCGRTFNPDRLKIHNRSCTADNPAKMVRAPVTQAGAHISAAVHVSAAAESKTAHKPSAPTSTQKSPPKRPPVRTAPEPPPPDDAYPDEADSPRPRVAAAQHASPGALEALEVRAAAAEEKAYAALDEVRQLKILLLEMRNQQP